MVLILVRHTTPQVASGTCYGQTDLDVCDSFSNEAARVEATLPPFVRIVTSPLQRCRKLAEALAVRRAVPITHDKRLAEMDFGRWEGSLWSEIPQSELDEWANNFLHARPHGGESVAMLRIRTREALQEVDVSRGPAVVVTHAGVIKAALSKGDTADAFDTSVPFGSFVEMQKDEGADQ